MTARKTPRTFRISGDGDRSYSEAMQEAMPPLEVTEAMRSAVAAYINSARLRAELIALARQHGERFAVTDEDVLDRAAFDQLLDPEFDAEQRRQLFRRLLGAAIAHQRLDGVDPQIINDEHRLRQLWNETCGWGDAVQALLDDASITEIKILGTTAIGEGARGRVVRPGAYTSAREPLSRAEFLAQSCGVAWNRSSPSVTLPLQSGMRMHITREPRVVAMSPDDPGLLIVMRRGRSRPWNLRDLIERGMLDRPSAELLAVLMHAGCSFVISGQQGAGKTTVLEALLNTRAPETHMVLVEDNTNEFRLPAGALVTRLRIDDSSISDAWRERQETVRENLRITPDLVVLSEVRGDEAGAVLQQAEAGRATLTTIHADSARAALQRFARLAAADVPNNSFSGAPEQGLRVLSEAFHVVIHIAFSQRLRRRYVQEVSILDGFAEREQAPMLIKLITTSIDVDIITWSCRASIREHAIVWSSDVIVIPDRVSSRLADLPDHLWQQIEHDLLAPPAALLADSGDQERDGALRRARTALRDGAWDDAAYYLTVAAQTRYDHPVITLVDQALQVPELVEPIDQEIAEATGSLQATLEAWDIDQARAISERAPATILVVRRRAGHRGWQQALAALARVQDEIATCQAALTHASAHRQRGDLSRALSVIRPISAQHLPPDLARTLLTARRSLLTQIVAQTQGDPGVQQHYMSELEQVNQDLAERQVGPTPPASTPAGDRSVSQDRADAPSAPRQPARPARPVVASAQPVETSLVVEHLPPTPPAPITATPPPGGEVTIAAAERASDVSSGRTGWLDAALAHSRERARLRQANQDGEED